MGLLMKDQGLIPFYFRGVAVNLRFILISDRIVSHSAA
jgi:hypothetical protein